MITLLVGENDYELTKSVASLKAAASVEAERYDAADLTDVQLADLFAGQTLFASERLIFIDTPSANRSLWQRMPEWAERAGEGTTIVLVEPKPDKRTSTYKWLKKNADVQEHSLLDDRSVEKWLKEYAASNNVALTAHQQRRLMQRTGADQWELAHVIDKLALVDEVNDEWIDDVVDDNPTESVFALFETVLVGDIPRLQTMVQTLKLTEDAYRIFGLIHTQALQLAVLVYGDANASRVAADIGAKSAYPYQKLAPVASRLSKSQVNTMLAELAASDIRLKSSDASPWLVLENTLARLASELK